MNKPQYKTRRPCTKFTEDEKAIESNCNAISFSNVGDWPCYINVKGEKGRFYLGQGMTIVFGQERVNVIETNIFSLTFDAAYVGAVTKECTVMRSYMEEIQIKKC